MDTLGFYDANAEEYALKTFEADLSSVRDRFVRRLPAGGKILDLGCGSGRNSVAFLENGFEVEAVDGSAKMCRIAEEKTGLTVRRLLFENLDYSDEFDGVWACSSLLHAPSDSLPKIFGRIRTSLKEDGIFFTCFKKGDFEGYRPEGRYYTDMTSDTLRSILENSGFEPLEIWEEDDRSPGLIWVDSISAKREKLSDSRR